jgi:hypothetical protein
MELSLIQLVQLKGGFGLFSQHCHVAADIIVEHVTVTMHVHGDFIFYTKGFAT